MMASLQLWTTYTSGAYDSEEIGGKLTCCGQPMDRGRFFLECSRCRRIGDSVYLLDNNFEPKVDFRIGVKQALRRNLERFHITLSPDEFMLLFDRLVVIRKIAKQSISYPYMMAKLLPSKADVIRIPVSEVSRKKNSKFFEKYLAYAS